MWWNLVRSAPNIELHKSPLISQKVSEAEKWGFIFFSSPLLQTQTVCVGESGRGG